jgi:alkylated DNA repair dioxygenase AlkB
MGRFTKVGLPGGQVSIDRGFIARDVADRLFEAIREQTPWIQHEIVLFGKQHPVPRLGCWMGDEGAVYSYSKLRLEPVPWSGTVSQILNFVHDVQSVRFNAVLLNLYRDGRDSMGFHADDEPELGSAPVIASVSLGSPRRFVFKPRGHPAPSVELELSHGSLLMMSGDTQANWLHGIPKTRREVGERLNLTFRNVRLGGNS